MTTHELALQLRRRQYDTGLIARWEVDALDDAEIIDCYVTCSECGERLIAGSLLPLAIAQADDAEGFLDLVQDWQDHAVHPGEGD